MTCDLNSSCCRLCPGVWIAVLLLIVMSLQSWLFPTPTAKVSSVVPETTIQQPEAPAAAAESNAK